MGHIITGDNSEEMLLLFARMAGSPRSLLVGPAHEDRGGSNRMSLLQSSKAFRRKSRTDLLLRG